MFPPHNAYAFPFVIITEGNLDLSTSLEGQSEAEAQAGFTGSADADVQAGGSAESSTAFETFLNSLFGASANNK